jgi:adenylosuccinate lyase
VIPRYSTPDMAALWTEAKKVETWLEVEVSACHAMTEAGMIPAEDFEVIRAGQAACDFEALASRALEIEATTKHDIIAFLTAFEELIGPASRHVHFGLTSSDVLDSAFALQLRAAIDIIERDLEGLLGVLARRAREHRNTPMVGRSHGIHAEPVTFGLVLAGSYAELARGRVRLRQAREEISVGKLAGAVGTNAHFSPDLEAAALSKLGLQPETVSTQVVPRDRHAVLFSALGLLASSLERLAVTIRHLQRTEVREVEEPFTVGQKGSSAMPHKRNPILTENVTGLARLVRGYVHTAMENVALWHERDISHSSVERVIAPDATIATSFMLRRMTRVIDGLVVYPERMRANLEMMRGLVFSQTVLLELAKLGLKRQEAYVMVQRASMRVWDEGLDLKSAILGDPELMTYLTRDALDACFDLKRHLRNVDGIIDRALPEHSA